MGKKDKVSIINTDKIVVQIVGFILIAIWLAVLVIFHILESLADIFGQEGVELGSLGFFAIYTIALLPVIAIAIYIAHVVNRNLKSNDRFVRSFSVVVSLVLVSALSLFALTLLLE